MAEIEVQKLVPEIEHMNNLVCQREEDVGHAEVMLRFREDKIKQLELLTDGMLSAEKYLMEENKALLEEIQLRQARIDSNPELTRYAAENFRLLEQLKLYQNFHEHGERETLLAEVSELRNQLLDTLEGNLPCSNENQVRYSFSKETEEFRQSDKYSIPKVVLFCCPLGHNSTRLLREESCRYMEVSRNKDKLEIQSELKRVIF
ncbi:hypothetical protein DVH24_025234 [Malus domestica]|uniref:Uncharacterized protein n=1 Tax=Malus domestica TaxID=3750 RepID=A0A498HS90_MALDO|nr:hypothetical protein DVH24_025234 [Malus domestica]